MVDDEDLEGENLCDGDTGENCGNFGRGWKFGKNVRCDF